MCAGYVGYIIVCSMQWGDSKVHLCSELQAMLESPCPTTFEPPCVDMGRGYNGSELKISV
jgi:hypothetical protein